MSTGDWFVGVLVGATIGAICSAIAALVIKLVLRMTGRRAAIERWMDERAGVLSSWMVFFTACAGFGAAVATDSALDVGLLYVGLVATALGLRARRAASRRDDAQRAEDAGQRADLDGLKRRVDALERIAGASGGGPAKTGRPTDH